MLTRRLRSYERKSLLTNQIVRRFSATKLAASSPFFSDQHESFELIESSLKGDVVDNLKNSFGIERPSSVQVGSFDSIAKGEDTIIAAETGSGKTLAYLLPLLYDLDEQRDSYSFCRAMILVPNKELANQVTRMCNAIFPDIKVGILPGGLKVPADYRPFRIEATDNDKIDVCVTVPANIAPFAQSPKDIDFFADIKTLVIDEADMLLDGGFLRNLNQVLMGFRRADKLHPSNQIPKTQYIFVAATLPDFGLKSVDAFINKRFPDATRVNMPGFHNARHSGLKDRTLWISEESNKRRLEKLVDLINSDFKENNEKIMVFLNNVENVDAASAALRRAGVNALPYHAKLRLEERVGNLEIFRNFDPNDENSFDENDMPVLVCSDLASRGLDIPGVTVVVQLQFALNVVSHLHRMGRAGRAGNVTGRGVIFFNEDGTESALVDVIREAESNQDTMTIEGNDVDPDAVQQQQVKKAFSRRRGFAKKRKKVER